jgi:RimJ/RimL family protein N-acetyltransferase
MDWVQREPEPVDEWVGRLRRFRARFDLGEDFIYGIFDRDETEVVGGTGLHARVGPDAFEIGYWIRANRGRQGFATETTAALTRVSFELCGVDRVELRIAPGNEKSLGVPRRLAFEEEGTLRRRLPNRDDAVVFSLFRDSFGGSPAAAAALEAFDAGGTRVL